MLCNGRNLCIREKKANEFGEIIIENNFIVVSNEKINVKEIYACLHCEELKNITIVVKGNEIYKVSLVLDNTVLFNEILKLIISNFPSLEISPQNIKINGYAEALVEKLKDGIAVTIIDAKDESAILICPECGMQCDPNIPYCMECGASL